MSETRFPTRTGAVNMKLLQKCLTRLPSVLEMMGYSQLRAGQDTVIYSVMSQRDTICVLPTSVGKTACFVIPTLCAEWHSLIFSPLVALMRDQVQGLRRMGIRASCMSGNQTDAENAMAAREWMAGRLDVFYVAPERLKNQMFKEAMRAQKPNLVAMDEAHCLSQWSDTFRPAYVAVGDFIVEQDPDVVMALSATVPDEVEEDIRRVLCLRAAEKVIYYPRRKNLILRSDEYHGLGQIATRLESMTEGAAIIYCGTIKMVEKTVQDLVSMLPGKQLTMYHGEMLDDQKRTNQDLFMTGRSPIVVATNAFGMGIDKPDVRFVFHRQFPGSVEALAQEVGRGGRDGKDCLCMTFHDDEAERLQRFFIEMGNPPKRDVEAVYHALERIQSNTAIIKMTLNEIAEAAGIRSMAMSAVMSIFIGAKVVERVDADEKIAKVKYVNGLDDPRFKDWMKLMKQGGDKDENEFWNFDIKWLMGQLGCSYETVRKNLVAWDKLEAISYIAPFRGKPCRLIGDLNLVDFERMQRRAVEAYDKLQQVRDYLDTPDEEKHAFLEEYFGIPITEE